MALGSSERSPSPAELAALPDDALIDAVQRQTFRFFWDGAHPHSALARDRCTTHAEPDDDLVVSGGSGFGIMAILVAIERGWVTRAAALERISRMVDLLSHAACFHGAFPHFLDGRTGVALPFSRKDDGGDIVETSLLLQGLHCAREYFAGDEEIELQLRKRITEIADDVEWTWYQQGGREVLYWHWSPNNGWAMDHQIRGWNECLITYVLAAGSNRYPIDPIVYHNGFAGGRDFLNGKTYHGIELPLGPPLGGPLFFAHYSFMGLDPRGLKDRYADYWQQNVAHVRINHAYCAANPNRHAGYSDVSWGITASDDPEGYDPHPPERDNGTIAPTAAAASLPYAPAEVLRALRHFLTRHGDKIWGRFGFVDAFNEDRNWFAQSYLAIDQAPIVVMMENHRSALLWKLFMRVPEVQRGLERLGFQSPVGLKADPR
jgi:hypothetical protein